MLTSVKYWLWLTNLLPPAQAWQVFQHFGSPETAYFSDPGEYAALDFLSPAQQKLLTDKSVAAAEQILARCDRQNIRILTFSDTDFPERLRNIEYPPLVLYLRGKLIRFDEKAVIGFAGTRKASAYGQKMAQQFAAQVTRCGGVVATGVVQGCDHCAALGALLSGGPLICVVPGGVDVPYFDTDPGRRFLDDVAAVGAILSENPPATQHKGGYFSRRNTILCGLSVGLLCVEAGRRSGTLGVASLASELGKDVFAVPANIDVPSSAGTNDLLRQGLAWPVICGDDVLSRYSYLLPEKPAPHRPEPVRQAPVPPAPAAQPVPPQAPAPRQAEDDSEQINKKKVDTAPKDSYIELLDVSERWSDEERILLRRLADGPATAESMIADSGLPASLVTATLVLLAVDGVVEELPGGRYQLCQAGLHP